MGFSRDAAGEEVVEEDDDLLPRATFVLPTLSSGPHSDEDREKYSLKNLFNAAKSGDTELVLNIFGFGHNVNHVFEEMSGQTSLHAAAQEGHLATAHLLVQAGAQLDTMDCEQLTPLMQAVLAGHAPVVKYLVKAGASLTLKVSPLICISNRPIKVTIKNVK
ncbi:hypothetical protein B566_EDAN015367 [Ephemera danica]|nr:hypothetical protein B566_EDAN015367 [Ephemera danica]